MPASAPYFVWTTHEIVTRETAAKIETAIKLIDPDALFVRHIAAGNETHGWIETENDGNRSSNAAQNEHRRMIEAAEKVIAANRTHSRRVVTWQAPDGAKFDVCSVCEKNHVPHPKNDRGQEYCSVSRGLHSGDCDHAS